MHAGRLPLEASLSKLSHCGCFTVFYSLWFCFTPVILPWLCVCAAFSHLSVQNLMDIFMYLKVFNTFFLANITDEFHEILVFLYVNSQKWTLSILPDLCSADHYWSTDPGHSSSGSRTDPSGWKKSNANKCCLEVAWGRRLKTFTGHVICGPVWCPQSGLPGSNALWLALWLTDL